jgi:tetratricopeptide (TPR) repeat protein
MRIRSLRRLFLVVLASTFVLAQRPAPSPGRGVPGNNSISNVPQLSEDTEIQIRVSYPNERPVGESIHVQLVNSAGIPIASTFTTHEGTAEFRNQKFGTYQLHLEGPSIVEMTTQRFQIIPGEGMHMEWVHVQPRDLNQAVGGKPQGQISTAEMNVPEKAREEVDKGMESLEKNELKDAEKHFKKAVEIYPQYARAWNNIGVVKAKEGDRAGASEAWQKAIDADAKFGSAYFNLARVSIANKQPAEAQKLIEKGLVGDPNDAEGLFLLTSAQAMQGHWDEALATAKRVHAGEHKSFVDVHMIAAQGYAALNQPKLAIGEYETYLKEYPDSPKTALVRQKMAQLQAKVQ